MTVDCDFNFSKKDAHVMRNGGLLPEQKSSRF